MIRCARCGKTTDDPDKWDPNAQTGIIYCDTCWPDRDKELACAVCTVPATVLVAGFPFCDEHKPGLVVGKGGHVAVMDYERVENEQPPTA